MASLDSINEDHHAEKRDSDRRKLIVDVHFAGGDATGIANTKDIGEGGLYMKTNTPLNEGAFLVLRLTIGGKTLRLEGKVVHSDPGIGAGISFINISESALELLRSEIEA
ncbi:MAG: PilZ domain-containing protein [Pyrinomonadaceae bacterium]|nr:PilZ domain-containing protein [Pyrinomonadaceae bacterium]